MADYDVVVVGGGPGGYVCAIKCAQLGLKTACVEGRGALGGTCLNVGCIPSKALLHASEKYHEAAHGLSRLGVTAAPELDFGKMQAYKSEQVTGLTKGVEGLFKKNKVTYVKGWGRIDGPGKVQVAPADGGKAQTLSTRNIVVATGSEPISLPGIKIDEKRIVSSTGALALERVPEKMAVIGGGYIGLEMGTVYQRLGAQVTCIEFLDRILPGVDVEAGKEMRKVLEKLGMSFAVSTKVTGAEAGKNGVALTLAPAGGGDETRLDVDVCLVAVGRRPYTDGAGLAEAGVAMTDKGLIQVDGGFRTSVDGIYAIGDVVDGPMLAHKAETEGEALAEALAGHTAKVNYATIPAVVYTWPEVAYVGLNEEQAKEAGYHVRSGKFPMMANSRARTMDESAGFVKLVCDADTDRIIGGTIVAPGAGEMIHEISMVMEFQGCSEDIARSSHAHPTLSESVREAAMAVTGKPIHM